MGLGLWALGVQGLGNFGRIEPITTDHDVVQHSPARGPESRISSLPIASLVVPFWGYLLGSLIYNWFKPKKGTTMETRGSIGAQERGV